MFNCGCRDTDRMKGLSRYHVSQFQWLPDPQPHPSSAVETLLKIISLYRYIHLLYVSSPHTFTNLSITPVKIIPHVCKFLHAWQNFSTGTAKFVFQIHVASPSLISLPGMKMRVYGGEKTGSGRRLSGNHTTTHSLTCLGGKISLGVGFVTMRQRHSIKC